MDKTRVYLERSKTSPIDLQIRRRGLSPGDPFLEIDPRAISRLKSLNLDGTPENFQDTSARLSHPAPLLETLTILVESLYTTRRYPAVTTELFDGDLSSLRELNLYCVRTELPWRNMVNLTSFKLCWTPPGEVSITQLLDFFESAPPPPRSPVPFCIPGLWRSRRATGTPGVSKGVGHSRGSTNHPPIRPPFDPSWCGFENTLKATSPPDQGPPPQISR